MKPHVTVHMITSVDGRIKTARWSPFEGRDEYEKVHGLLAGDAWMCGRVTMAGYARIEAPYPETDEVLPRTDHIARRDAPAYAVALDGAGRIAWGRDAIEADHVVVVLRESVPDAHLAGLRRDGVSYVFGGRDAIDLARVLETLNREFGIKRLLVEGGGRINGSMLEAGLVDELSLLSSQPREGGVMWLRYRVARA